MSLDRRSIALAVSAIALLLLIAVQVLTWREHRQFNSGAFLLMIFVIGPLFVGRHKGSP